MLQKDPLLLGWFTAQAAFEPFAIAAAGLFLPLTLEELARTRAGCAEGDTGCRVRWLGLEVETASYALYVASAAVAAQALLVISLGSIADHPPHRLRLLLIAALSGSTSLLLFSPLTSLAWPTSALLSMLANASFGVGMVCLNAFLPGLARARVGKVEDSSGVAEEVEGLLAREAEAEGRAGAGLPGEDAEVLLPKETEAENELARTTAHLSARGLATGYASGILSLLILLIPLLVLHSSLRALNLCILLTGVIWALLFGPAYFLLRRGSPKAESEEARDAVGWRDVGEAWRRLGRMFRREEMGRLRNTYWFLLSWTLLSDGFATITSTAILFAKTQLSMPASSLLLIMLISPISGVLGALLYPRLQRHLDWSNRSILILLVLLASLIPIYGCLGFLPVFSRIGFGGLTRPAEMYVLAVWFGSTYAPFQSYTRAVFSALIPPNEEARWFGLYSITDKSTSFLGPFVVGVVADHTNIRFGFLFLIVLLLLPVPLLATVVDVEQGRRDAEEYSKARERDRAANVSE